MSTRCQIAFYEKIEQPLSKWDALIYKHSDGYPDGVLPELEAFASDFNARRGLNDSEYAAAWYLMFLFKQHLALAEGYRKSYPEKEGVEQSKVFPELKSFGLYLGYGVSKQLHGDIEFFYAVFPNRIETYEVLRDARVFGEASRMRTFDGSTFDLKKVINL